jgi:hypothetical protein
MEHTFFQRYNFTDPQIMAEERKKFVAYVRQFTPSWEESNN